MVKPGLCTLAKAGGISKSQIQSIQFGTNQSKEMKNPIRQFIHADGWRAYSCILGDDDKPVFTEEPLCCWALDDTGKVCPLVFEEGEAIDFIEEDHYCKGSAGLILGPGQTLTEDLKKQLETRARNKARK